ncbi:uncharacterized protein LOC110867210 [Helianthus annuus]|uniref:uncharacterized protein LOC110867210 n=1 Tax=Helianthus annuus TaxID=4232 RepID=UPI000B8EE9B3|nr:uncharacterized protein LOC110867210 [Helianthus annuus]
MAGSDEVNSHPVGNRDDAKFLVTGAELKAIVNDAVAKALERQYNAVRQRSLRNADSEKRKREDENSRRSGKKHRGNRDSKKGSEARRNDQQSGDRPKCKVCRKHHFGRCRRVWKRKEDGWNTIQNKQDFKQERRFDNREARLRNATSFFISNLPDFCDKEVLWKAFDHLDNLEDVFVPTKRDRAGNKFGFIKLSHASDTEWWIEKLKEVRVGGAVIGVNRAKFNRDGSKSFNEQRDNAY